jgi:hypothetical protein
MIMVQAQSGPTHSLTQSQWRWLAWSLAGLTVPLMVGTVFLVWLGRGSPWRAPGDYDFTSQLIAVLGNAPTLMIGALIATRQPRNAYGWLWLVSGFSFSLTQLVAAYALHGLLIAPGSLPLAGQALALTGPVWLLNLAMGPFVLLLFPTGQLPSPHWRIVAWIVIGALLSGVALSWTLPGLSGFVPAVENPYHLQGHAGDIVEGVVNSSVIVIFIAIMASVLSLLLRFQRATGVERQQLKWFSYGGVLVGLGLLSEFFYPIPGSWEHVKEAIVFNLLPALTIGVAMLRYHLYAIDLLIRRTLQYSVLTVTLALVYFSSVVLLQLVFQRLTDQAQSQLVTVFSTLMIVALFTPLRHRVQAGIDRHFYRRRYNIANVLAEFAALVRNETDLEQLKKRLVAVVEETMQPVQMSLWLTPAPPVLGTNTKTEAERANE